MEDSAIFILRCQNSRQCSSIFVDSLHFRDFVCAYLVCVENFCFLCPVVLQTIVSCFIQDSRWPETVYFGSADANYQSVKVKGYEKYESGILFIRLSGEVAVVPEIVV